MEVRPAGVWQAMALDGLQRQGIFIIYLDYFTQNPGQIMAISISTYLKYLGKDSLECHRSHFG